MLDLMRWKRVSKTSAYFDARPPEEGAYILTRGWTRWKKQCGLRRWLEQPEGQVLVGRLLIVDL
jgi:hypothetical protein